MYGRSQQNQWLVSAKALNVHGLSRFVRIILLYILILLNYCFGFLSRKVDFKHLHDVEWICFEMFSYFWLEIVTKVYWKWLLSNPYIGFRGCLQIPIEYHNSWWHWKVTPWNSWLLYCSMLAAIQYYFYL